MQLFNLSIIPFLLIYRFYIVAVYYTILVVVKALLQIRHRNFKCFEYQLYLAIKNNPDIDFEELDELDSK